MTIVERQKDVIQIPPFLNLVETGNETIQKSKSITGHVLCIPYVRALGAESIMLDNLINLHVMLSTINKALFRGKIISFSMYRVKKSPDWNFTALFITHRCPCLRQISMAKYSEHQKLFLFNLSSQFGNSSKCIFKPVRFTYAFYIWVKLK